MKHLTILDPTVVILKDVLQVFNFVRPRQRIVVQNDGSNILPCLCLAKDNTFGHLICLDLHLY